MRGITLRTHCSTKQKRILRNGNEANGPDLRFEPRFPFIRRRNGDFCEPDFGGLRFEPTMVFVRDPAAMFPAWIRSCRSGEVAWALWAILRFEPTRGAKKRRFLQSGILRFEPKAKFRATRSLVFSGYSLLSLPAL